MRPKSLLLLGLALGCGLVASIGISQVMDRNAGHHTKLETVPIYVAVHNINLGDPIEADMLSLQEWPKDKVPRGAISTLEELEGRRPRTAIIEGEPILEGKLLEPGQMADPIRQIPKGMRLKTIAVDAEKSAAGLLGPGDRVDVQVFLKKDDRTGIETAKSKTILQNIRVFAVDQTVQRAADGGEERTVAKTVSLVLTPQQASTLSLAEQVGEVSLTPRNPDDEVSADWTESTIEDLLGESTQKNSRAIEQGVAKETTAAAATNDLANAVQAAAPVARPQFRMEIVEAQDVREVVFDSETGRPIRQPEAPAAAGGPTLDSSSAGGPTPGDGEKASEDFPVNLDGAN